MNLPTSAIDVTHPLVHVPPPINSLHVERYGAYVVVVALLRSIRRSLLGPGLWGVSGILLSSSVASRDRLGLSS